MDYEIYTISGSPRAWRGMLGFVAKALPFTIKVLELSKQQHKAPDFLALNPRGRVPVLKHGALVLSESLAILAYLERLHPEPAIFGTTAQEHARIWQLVSEGEHYLRDSNHGLLAPILFGEQDDTDRGVRQGSVELHGEFKRLEQLLANAPFLAGERMTAADCVCFPEARLVLRANERFPDIMRRLELHPLDEMYPRLREWVARIEALPGYEATVPPHWASRQ